MPISRNSMYPHLNHTQRAERRRNLLAIVRDNADIERILDTL